MSGSRVERVLGEFRSHDYRYTIVLALLIGVLGGLGNLGFQALIDLFRHISWGGADNFTTRFVAAPVWLKLGAPTLAGLIGGLVIYYFAPEAKGHGVPEVMKAVALKGGVLPRSTVLGKAVASAMCLATGGSVGREGPIVQIGSAMGSTVGRLLKLNTPRMRTVVACGATAGIAATFNAPIAGAFFSAEVILGDFGVGQFAPLVASAVVATLVSQITAGGNDPAFHLPENLTLNDGRELILYALLGLAAALVAVGFMKALHWAEDFFDGLPIWPPLRVTLGGLGVGLVGMVAPEVLGNGYGSITAVMHGELLLGTMGLLLLVKVLATSTTLGSGNSGGIFAPSLFMGVMMGGFLGRIFHAWFPAWTAAPGAYALVGMGAVVGAAIHAPITAIIMIFEMTRDYALILPLMLSVVSATLFSQKLQRHSIYTFKLARQGIDLLRGKDFNVLRRLKVGDVMDRRYDAIDQCTPLMDVLGHLAASSHHESLVLDGEGRLTGILTVDEVKRALPQIQQLGTVLIAQDMALDSPPTLRSDDDLDFAMRTFGKQNIEEIPVMDPEDPSRPIGLLVRHDVIKAYNRAVLEDNLAESASSRIQASMGGRRVTETLGGYVLEEIEAPVSMRGRSLGELDFRGQTRCQVLLLRRKGGDGDGAFELPARDTVLGEGDNLLVFGKSGDVQRVRNL